MSKVYVIIGFGYDGGNKVFDVYRNLDVAKACMQVHELYNEEYNDFGNLDIVEFEIELLDDKVYLVVGTIGYDSEDLIDVCNTFESAELSIRHDDKERKRWYGESMYDEYEIVEVKPI